MTSRDFVCFFSSISTPAGFRFFTGWKNVVSSCSEVWWIKTVSSLFYRRGLLPPLHSWFELVSSGATSPYLFLSQVWPSFSRSSLLVFKGKKLFVDCGSNYWLVLDMSLEFLLDGLWFGSFAVEVLLLGSVLWFQVLYWYEILLCCLGIKLCLVWLDRLGKVIFCPLELKSHASSLL